MPGVHHPCRRRPLPPIEKSHPHIAKQIVATALKKKLTPGVDRAITFICVRCKKTFRRRVDNVVRSGKVVCRGCSTSPDSLAELVVVKRIKILMQKLCDQGVVRSYEVIRNRKVSVAELASVKQVSKKPLRWDITVVSKVGATDYVQGMRTQLVHIELDGRQHFCFSALWHKGSQEVYRRSITQDRIKDDIVRNSTSSGYGARFKRVSLLRVALVRPLSKHQENKHRCLRQRKQDTKLAIKEAADVSEQFLIQELTDPQEGHNVKLHPPGVYAGDAGQAAAPGHA